MTNSLTFIDQFNFALTSGLPGEAAHRLLSPINRPLTSSALKEFENYRKSAVSILLFKKDNSIHCILTQRKKYDGAHSQQVSFPGGKMDLSDVDLEYTARRESFEEIMLPKEHGILISELSDIYIPVSRFIVKPFVFYIDELPKLKAEEREVDEIFSFDIFRLLENEAIQTTDIKLAKGIRKNVPYFSINNKVVWGATAMILSELREILKRF